MKILRTLLLITITLILSSATTSAQQHKLEDILTKLNSEQIANRIWAADELAWGEKTKTPEVLDALLKTLKDNNHQVRYAAISALERFGDNKAVEPLKNVYNSDPVIRLRNKARKAIFKLTKEKLPAIKDTQKLEIKPVQIPKPKTQKQYSPVMENVAALHTQITWTIIIISFLIMLIPGIIIGLLSDQVVRRIRYKVFGWFINILYGIASLCLVLLIMAFINIPVFILTSPYAIYLLVPWVFIFSVMVNIALLLLVTQLRANSAAQNNT